MFKFIKRPKQFNTGKIVIPVGHTNPPASHEIEVAKLLAQHYEDTVEFIMPVDDYKRKTPDIRMLGVEWEIKSPKGKSKSTIGTQISRASKQACNIIIDTRHTKLKYEKIEKSVKMELKKRHTIKRVILINKAKKIVEYYK